MTATLSGLYIYPVKSAAGIACDSALLGAAGLAHDREWMIVDEGAHFITQRNEARLALLRVALGDGELRLSNPQGPGPALPLDHEGASREVLVWRSHCAAFDAGDEVAQFLSDWLGRPLRLVRLDPRHRRLSNPDWTAGRVVQTRFTDGYPLLVVTQASIDDLAARVAKPLEVERFRPNLVLAGTQPYAEDAADSIDVGPARFALTKPCTRCVITTIDPARGERDGDEPMRTLRGYRFDKQMGGVLFGRNAYALAGEGQRLARGMPVTLLPG